jgi:valyl-tRNA synthetase
VTEEIYGKLPNVSGLLTTAAYPQPEAGRRDAVLEADFSALQDLVRQIRTLRSEFQIPNDKKLRILVRTEPGFASTGFFRQQSALVESLAGTGTLEFEEARPGVSDRPPLTIGLVGKGFEAFVFIREAIDIVQLTAKFTRELERDEKFLVVLEAKLANENFVKNAPVELVDAEKEKLEETKRRIGKLGSYIRDLT